MIEGVNLDFLHVIFKPISKIKTKLLLQTYKTLAIFVIVNVATAWLKVHSGIKHQMSLFMLFCGITSIFQKFLQKCQTADCHTKVRPCASQKYLVSLQFCKLKPHKCSSIYYGVRLTMELVCIRTKLIHLTSR